jgi:diguanylate cyclase (GGDEF)-like protein/PAS domain S-box-containing protein
MCQDITSRVEAERALRRSEETYRQIVDTAREGVWLVDEEARTSFVNTRMAEILGYAPDEMLGKPFYEFVDEKDRPDAEKRFANRQNGMSEQHDCRFRRKDGEDVWTIVSACPMYNADGSFAGSLGMITDITERKQHEEMVWWQAYHDPLTQLPNRALFEDRLGQLLVMSHRQGGHVAVLFLDLDRFKHVNDTLGHGIGDRLLKVVAERLTGCLRAEDTIARMGGDEFTVLLPGIDQPESAAKVAQKLLDALAQPIVIDGQELFAAGSIGISIFPEDGQDPQTLLKHADVAMYRAKEQGGNGYYLFTQSMNRSALEHLIMENSLRKAISRKEFNLVYQPQIDLASGQVTAVEALCRWRHPDLGTVQPAQFIPLAEETGIIVALGEWVLNEACRQAAEWYAAGQPLRVSVNISARQFAQPDLPDMIASILAEHNLAPEWLDLELTESAIMKNAESAVDILNHLRRLGVRLSLDDFGTGYSSLSYLRKFPFDVLKIDRSFVMSLVDDPVDEAVVRAIVDLARALNLEVVSEGIETDEQCRALQDLGCNIMQGYLFSPPVPPERISALKPLMCAERRAA